MKNVYALLLLAATWLPLAVTMPAAPRAPLITPAPAYTPTKTYKGRRGVVSDIESIGSDIAGDIESVLSELGSVPSYVASGVANFFQDFPTGEAVLKTLGISDSDLDAVPTQVLNIPGYANYTDQGWNLRIHGNVYKQPYITQSKLDDLANIFLIGTSVEELPAAQASQARNLTAEIFVVQQGNEHVTFSIAPAPTAGAQPDDGGAVPATGGAQTIDFPYETTFQGDFDAFVPLQSNGLLPGNDSNTPIQRLNIYTQGTDTGNATGWLVPDQGLTVISDIDDILRVTKIYEPKEGLLNSFARAFTPWINMPEIYANWSSSLKDFHFHYLTTTPEQVTRNYMDFIYKTYPGGSFDTRPLNFSDVSATLSIRKFLLDKIFQTFPQRKFILVADTSNSDVMKDYPALVSDFPNQVQCIFLRNTSATDPGDKFPYDTSGFKNVNTNSYMFFNVPDDLKGLDIANGQCVNASVPQHVTFSWQGLPFGLSKDKPDSGAGPKKPHAPAWAKGIVAAWLLVFQKHLR